MYGINSVIEFLPLMFGNKVRCVHDAQELLARLWMYPQVHTQKLTDTDETAGFLLHFADHGLLRGFTAFDMAAGLRDDHDPGRPLLDDQEPVVPLDYSTNGEVSG